MPNKQSNLSTGESLGLFYKELLQAGLPNETALEIVRDTAREVTAGGQYSIHGEASND